MERGNDSSVDPVVEAPSMDDVTFTLYPYNARRKRSTACSIFSRLLNAESRK